MKRIFITRTFTRWMRKAGLADQALCQAVSEMSQGLIDANLGGNVVKKRVPLPGRGNGVEPERLSPPIEAIAGSFYMALRRTNVPISTRTK